MNLGGLILLSLALGLAAWLFFLWTVRSGQYEDPEGPKYRMLEDDDGEVPTRPQAPDVTAGGTTPNAPSPRPSSPVGEREE